MIKVLKLGKAVIAIILGIVALIISQVMRGNHVNGNSIVLAIAGGLFIAGALMFLYPIIFAKKVDSEGSKVELEPISKKSADQ